MNVRTMRHTAGRFFTLMMALSVSACCSVCPKTAPLRDDSLVLWKAFNNVDPRRDIRRTRWGLLIDATRKGPADGHTRPWPDDIVMSGAIIKLVDEKFPEFGKG